MATKAPTTLAEALAVIEQLREQLFDAKAENDSLRDAIVQLESDGEYSFVREFQQAKENRRLVAALEKLVGPCELSMEAASSGCIPSLTALVQLGANCQENAVTADAIANRRNISSRTVNTHINRLKLAGFAASCRGHGAWATADGLKVVQELDRQQKRNRNDFSVAAG